MFLILYNLLLPWALLASLPGLYRKMRRRGGYGRDFLQRFGYYSAATRERLGRLDSPIWIHAVSVGEVLIAARLIDALRREAPGRAVVLTTTTSTGYATARERLPELEVFYSPLDLGGVVRRALDLVRPSQIVLTESELWPNLISLASSRSIPVRIVNARFSPRSRDRYLRFRRLLRPLLTRLDLVCVQEEEDLALWSQLGLPPERIVHTGSIKFDPAAAAPDLRQEARFASLLDGLWPAGDGPRILLGSSHAGEEALLAEAVRGLRGEFPRIKLLAAPRHAERRREVAADLEGAGLTVELRSRLPLSAPPPGTPDALIVDSTGELRSWYATADVVVIGKSFLAEGGQNPVEPILAGKPVAAGPHMENFAALVERLEAADGILRVTDAGSLRQCLAGLLRNPEEAANLALRGRAVLQPHLGATRRTARQLLQPPHASL